MRLLAVAGLGVFLGEKIDLATFDPGLGALVIVINTALISATVFASTLVRNENGCRHPCWQRHAARR